jgi:hypothetical protein
MDHAQDLLSKRAASSFFVLGIAMIIFGPATMLLLGPESAIPGAMAAAGAGVLFFLLSMCPETNAYWSHAVRVTRTFAYVALMAVLLHALTGLLVY